jgi:hypothetical protein
VRSLFKPLVAVLETDPRYQTTVVEESDSTLRYMTLADHHGQVASLNLHVGVPGDVRDLFDVARNAFVYSWFAYEMATLAEHHVFAVVERALRARLLDGTTEQTRRKKIEGAGLEWLLDTAKGRKLIRHDDFRLPPMYPDEPVLNMLPVLVRIRNDLSHGRWHLYPEGSVTVLEYCAELLNRLYSLDSSGNYST